MVRALSYCKTTYKRVQKRYVASFKVFKTTICTINCLRFFVKAIFANLNLLIYFTSLNLSIIVRFLDKTFNIKQNICIADN